MTKMADLEISHFWSRRGKRALRDIAPPYLGDSVHAPLIAKCAPLIKS